MKKLIVLSFILLLGCEYDYSCDCDYFVSESNPLNNHRWTETYRSYWDASCYDELLDQSTYTDYDGGKWYSKTYIECK